jgi:hypothetical protein
MIDRYPKFSRRAAGLALGVIAVLSLAGCVDNTMPARAKQGSGTAELAMFRKALTGGPDGSAKNLAQAEYWSAQLAESHAQWISTYAFQLLWGTFGHFDEKKAEILARSAPPGDPGAKQQLTWLKLLRTDENARWALWSKLYGEARALCPDHYKKAGSALDKQLANTSDDVPVGYGLLPEKLSIKDPNRHAYILAVRECLFSAVEQLSDPEAYRAYADWLESPLYDKPKFAVALRSLAAHKFGAKKPSGVHGKRVSEARRLAARIQIFNHYSNLVKAQGKPAQPHWVDEVAPCTNDAAKVSRLLQQAKYAEALKITEGRLPKECATEAGKASARVSTVRILAAQKRYQASLERGLDALHRNLYYEQMQVQLMNILEYDCVHLGKERAFDRVVAALRARYPALTPADF